MSSDTTYLERMEVSGTKTLDLGEYEHQARYRWAASLLGNKRVLDIACGTGHGSEVLAAANEVTGIDRAPEALDAARERCDAEFVQADTPPVPLDDDAVDSVVCFETIEHIEPDREFIVELARVLRPGGELLISTPNRPVTSPDGIVRNQFHVREYSLSEIADLLSAAGLEIVQTLGQSSDARGRGHQLLRSAVWRLRPAARFSDRLRRFIFGRVLDRDVRPMTEAERPDFWILRCRLSATDG